MLYSMLQTSNLAVFSFLVLTKCQVLNLMVGTVGHVTRSCNGPIVRLSYSTVKLSSKFFGCIITLVVTLPFVIAEEMANLNKEFVSNKSA